MIVEFSEDSVCLATAFNNVAVQPAKNEKSFSRLPRAEAPDCSFANDFRPVFFPSVGVISLI